jgi:hypothetical protein
MKTKRLPLLVGIVLLLTLAFVGVASACEYGCTPGYWKNHPDAWPCLNPDSIMVPPDTDLNGDGQADTFMDALNYKGGSGDIGAERILLRAGVAAYLNECAFRSEEFPNDWQDEFFGYLDDPAGQRDNMLGLADYLDSLNNGVCEFT